MKVLITGGHFSPAYSLIKELKKRGDIVAIAGRKNVFEGDSTNSLEYEIAKKENIKFFEIKTGRVQRKFSVHTIPSLIKILKGFSASLSVLSEFKPDIVLTFGGYIAFPVVYAAALKKIPVVLHEQTPKAGLASRVISRVATKICISFESSKAYFPLDRTVFTGIPIREEVFKIQDKIPLPEGRKIIYVTGGSSGSHFINNLIGQTVGRLTKNYAVIHQSGDNSEFDDFLKLTRIKEDLPPNQRENYILKKFIYPSEIGYVFDKADLVVSRSGINTSVELLALGKPCFLIPLSHGQTNEQPNNAKLVVGTGIGRYMEERYLSANKFYEEIIGMMKNIGEYEKEKENASHYIVTDAADRIIKVVDNVYGKAQ